MVEPPENLLTMKLHLLKINGKPAIEIRKAFRFCEKNNSFIQNLIKASLSEMPIIAKVKIEFSDKLKASSTLKQNGFFQTDSKKIEETLPKK